jgi:small multidrug resistance pump
MAWIYLIIAIASEVVGTLLLKVSSNSDNHFYTILFVIFYILSFTLIWYAIKTLDIGLVYAIWAGLGTALVAIFSWLIFKEDMSLLKIFFILLIIIGAVGLKYTSGK